MNFIEKNMKNWRVELTAGGKAWLKQRSKEVYSKDMNYHDATKPHTQKMHGQIKTY